MVGLIALFGSNWLSFSNKIKSRTKYFQFSLIPQVSSVFTHFPCQLLQLCLIRAPLSLLTVVWLKHTSSSYR